MVCGIGGLSPYCTACHGVDGQGNGPIAPRLRDPPTDLTQLSKHHNGHFPRQRVYDVIDGQAEVRAHGPRDMPVWGEKFKAGDGREAENPVCSAGLPAMTASTRTPVGPPSTVAYSTPRNPGRE